MDKRCELCGRPYDGNARSKYCDACKASLNRARAAENYYRHKAEGQSGNPDTKRKIGQTDICKRCGSSYVIANGNQKYCPDCSAPAYLEAVHRYMDAKAASDRGQEITPTRDRKQYRQINIKICAVCKKPFAAPPSSKRVCCSKACSSIRKAQAHAGKSNKWSDEAKARNADKWTIDNLSKGTAAALKLPEGQRGPQNRESMRWFLRDPDGKVYEVVNLLDWCRNNAGLFGKKPTDHNAKVIASGFHGVKRSMVGKRKPPVNSYMGWTILGWQDNHKNGES